LRRFIKFSEVESSGCNRLSLVASEGKGLEIAKNRFFNEWKRLKLPGRVQIQVKWGIRTKIRSGYQR